MALTSLKDLFSEAGVQHHQACRGWLAENRSTLPEAVAENLTAVMELVEPRRDLAPRHRGVLRRLLRVMRILPSSERHRGSARDDDDDGAPRGRRGKILDPIARLRHIEQRAKELAAWHRACARNQKAKESAAQRKRMKLEELEEDVKRSAEDEAELAVEQAAFEARCYLGDGADPRYAAHAEAWMHGASCTVRTEEIDCEVDRQSLPKGAHIKQVFAEERARLDFSFAVTVQNVAVEKVSVQDRHRHHLGQRGYGGHWARHDAGDVEFSGAYGIADNAICDAVQSLCSPGVVAG